MRKFKTDMGKNSQNVIISTDGMRNVMNIIKKKKKKYKKAANSCYKRFRRVYCSKTKSHFRESQMRVMVEAKKSRFCAVPAGNYLKDNNYN